MAEYIDKVILYDEVTEKEKYLDELLQNVTSGSIEADIYLGGITGILWVKQLIEDTPPSEVAPVVHAKWCFDEDGYAYCSKCGKYSVSLHGDNYCRCCGAKMDLED